MPIACYPNWGVKGKTENSVYKNRIPLNFVIGWP